MWMNGFIAMAKLCGVAFIAKAGSKIDYFVY
jgi:hypothetical protein